MRGPWAGWAWWSSSNRATGTAVATAATINANSLAQITAAIASAAMFSGVVIAFAGVSVVAKKPNWCNFAFPAGGGFTATSFAFLGRFD